MLKPDPLAARRSRLRWYFGVVGLIGGLALLITATEGQLPAVWRALAAAGLPVAAAYVGVAVAFPRFQGEPRPLFLTLGAAMLWIGALAVLIALRSTLDQLVPVALFLAIPCANAAMRAQDTMGPPRG